MSNREYQRGYNRGRSRMQNRIMQVLAIAKAYRSRAISAERKIFGGANWISRECQTCARWTRGGEGCLWGVCGNNFEPSSGEPWMQAEHGPITTREEFGCCNWLHHDHPLRPPFRPSLIPNDRLKDGNNG